MTDWWPVHRCAQPGRPGKQMKKLLEAELEGPAVCSGCDLILIQQILISSCLMVEVKHGDLFTRTGETGAATVNWAVEINIQRGLRWMLQADSWTLWTYDTLREDLQQLWQGFEDFGWTLYIYLCALGNCLIQKVAVMQHFWVSTAINTQWRRRRRRSVVLRLRNDRSPWLVGLL